MPRMALKHASRASLFFVAFVLCVSLLSYADSLAEKLNMVGACDNIIEGVDPLLVKDFEPSSALNQVIFSLMTSSYGDGHVSVPYFAASVLAMALVLF